MFKPLIQNSLSAFQDMDPVRRRIVLTIFATQSLFSAAMIAAFTLMSVTAADLSGSDSFAGLPATVLTFSRAALAFPLGIILDRYGRRNGLSSAYATGIAGGLVGVLAIEQGSFLLFLLAAALMGIARGGAEQSRFVAAEVFKKARQGRVIGIVVFAGTIGAIGGPRLLVPAGDLFQRWSLNADGAGWGIVALFSVLGALIVFLFLRPDPLELSQQAKESAAATATTRNERPLREIFGMPKIQLAVAAMLISQTVMQLLMTITGVYMKNNDLGTPDIASVIMAHTLGMFGFSWLTGYLIDRFGRLPMIIVGGVILMASCIIAPLAPSMLVIVTSMFLLGLGWNFCFVGGSSLLSESLSTEERGRAQGLNETFVALVAGFGSLSSGPIFRYGDYLAVSIFGGGLVLVLAVLILRYNLRPVRVAKQAV